MDSSLEYDNSQKLSSKFPNTSLYDGEFAKNLSQSDAANPIFQFHSKAAMTKRELESLRMKQILYGFHAPFQLVRERIMVSQSRRLAPLPSSLLSLDILMNKDDTFEIEDYLNVVEPEVQFPNLNEHQLIEKRLGYDLC